MNRIRRFRALVIAALAFVPLIALYGWGAVRRP
jgi:hypothetical protein